MKAKEIWEEVNKNQRKLDSCDSHEFTIDLAPELKMNKRWQCKHCMGEVSGTAKRWYELGKKHKWRD